MQAGDQVRVRLADGQPLVFGWVAKAVSDAEANLFVIDEDGHGRAVQGATLVKDDKEGHDYFVPPRRPASPDHKRHR